MLVKKSRQPLSWQEAELAETSPPGPRLMMIDRCDHLRACGFEVNAVLNALFCGAFCRPTLEREYTLGHLLEVRSTEIQVPAESR